MDNLEWIGGTLAPFPHHIIREIHYPNEASLREYLLYSNIAEAVLDLVKGPDVEVYVSEPGGKDWCLPMTKYEAAMYILRPEHLPFLLHRLFNIEMEAEKFFLLFFLLCAEPGKYKFEPIFNAERFNDMTSFAIYRELTGIDSPTGEYTLIPLLQSLIYKYFLNKSVLYYFLVYSRRVIFLQDYFSNLHRLSEQPANIIDSMFDNDDFKFPTVSVTNNAMPMLVTEYYQNFNPNKGGRYALTSAQLVSNLGLDRPQHKSRRQLMKISKYVAKDLTDSHMLPRFVENKEDPNIINIEYGGNELWRRNYTDANIYRTEGYFSYYAVALTSKIKSEFNQVGPLDTLVNIYNNYRYGIEFLYELTKISDTERKSFVKGLAAYHLLYQCMSGRTSKYIDMPKQKLSKKPMLEILQQIIEKEARICTLLRTIPLYRKSDIIQMVYPIRYVLDELTYYYVDTDEIDNTIGIICEVLEVEDYSYARVINKIIHKLRLREYYGIIKTKFNPPDEEIDLVKIKKFYHKMNLIADFQGRNSLMIPTIIGNRYDVINYRFRIKYVEEWPDMNQEENHGQDYENEENIYDEDEEEEYVA